MRHNSKILRRILAAATLATATLGLMAAPSSAQATGDGVTPAAGHICRQEPSNCWTDVGSHRQAIPKDAGGTNAFTYYGYTGPRGMYSVSAHFQAFDELLHINAIPSRGSVARVNVWIEGQGWVSYRADPGTRREGIELGYDGDIAEGSSVRIQVCWGNSDDFCTGYARATA
ncbi:hypothetical protein Bcav_0214 [Beutenbergia cavernae DSM 12333]|uniref:Secreted protein n=1 Tax=Beutenbergia cavernae (strain ATCC BAA-8 / DSM 12333 / CCUG 43141 / JCM 11478 / NBRC 16432 / NCIMB 13614 / HKI 0122) TaxID=471853 RepID=C5BVN9_BEUC1|nr:hypothetical protein [Beutenbergia cavernae]ACQ78479.1 hypothetical protein Bcav_0214 [Beutenbergia cavernae DSM 12333]